MPAVVKRFLALTSCWNVKEVRDCSMQADSEENTEKQGRSPHSSSVEGFYPWWCRPSQQQSQQQQSSALVAGSESPETVPSTFENTQNNRLVVTHDEQQQQPAAAMFLSPAIREYKFLPTQLGIGHTMGYTGYPFANPFFGGIIAAAYGAQMMINPPSHGTQHDRVCLPLEIVEGGLVYFVNPKQYHGIMRRRRVRARAESENKLIKVRKPYLHESRHLHAMRRARGCGGRFLNTKNKGKSGVGSTDSSNNHSSGNYSDSVSRDSLEDQEMERGLICRLALGGTETNGVPSQAPGAVEQSGSSVHGCHHEMCFCDAYIAASSRTCPGRSFQLLPGGCYENDRGENREMMCYGPQQEGVGIC